MGVLLVVAHTHTHMHTLFHLLCFFVVANRTGKVSKEYTNVLSSFQKNGTTILTSDVALEQRCDLQQKCCPALGRRQCRDHDTKYNSCWIVFIQRT